MASNGAGWRLHGTLVLTDISRSRLELILLVMKQATTAASSPIDRGSSSTPARAKESASPSTGKRPFGSAVP